MQRIFDIKWKLTWHLALNIKKQQLNNICFENKI